MAQPPGSYRQIPSEMHISARSRMTSAAASSCAAVSFDAASAFEPAPFAPDLIDDGGGCAVASACAW